MNPAVNAFEWSLSPVLFSLGPIQIRWYGLLFALGFVVGYQIMNWIYTREKKNIAHLESLTLTMILSTIVGARLGHCLFYAPEVYLPNPLEILKVWEGGLASHGAAVGILFGLFIFKNRTKTPYIWILDRIVIVIALAGFFIRVGNFFNSEIIGKPTNSAFAMVFSRHDTLPRHPAQLYEAFSYLIIFLILFFGYKKDKFMKEGSKFGFFLITVFGMRFIWEYFKENQVAFESSLPLNMGQLLSIPLVLIGIYFMAIYNKTSDE